MKKKADRRTRKLLDSIEGMSPNDIATSWQGRVAVLNPEKSYIAKRMDFKEIGEYCIKFR